MLCKRRCALQCPPLHHRHPRSSSRYFRRLNSQRAPPVNQTAVNKRQANAGQSRPPAIQTLASAVARRPLPLPSPAGIVVLCKHTPIPPKRSNQGHAQDLCVDSQPQHSCHQTVGTRGRRHMSRTACLTTSPQLHCPHVASSHRPPLHPPNASAQQPCSSDRHPFGYPLPPAAAAAHLVVCSRAPPPTSRLPPHHLLLPCHPLPNLCSAPASNQGLVTDPHHAAAATRLMWLLRAASSQHQARENTSRG
jgi:hypothetical protein